MQQPKIFLLIFLISAFACSCNSSSVNKKEIVNADSLNSSNTTEMTANKKKAEEENESTSVLTLNNGIKWKADSITNENVKSIKNISDKSSGEKEKTLIDYHKCADEFQKAVNKMIEDCRMKGPDHEALHRWLHPLLNEIKKLNEATDTTEAENIFSEIQNQLNLYNNFFE